MLFIDQIRASSRSDHLTAESARRTSKKQLLQPFSGGTLRFYFDRVELCGADICRGPRSKNRRIVLELLSQKQSDGLFVAFSGDHLQAAAGEFGSMPGVGGLIRDLRKRICGQLHQVNIVAGRDEVVLSGGRGYRLSRFLTVQYVDEPLFVDISDIEDMLVKDNVQMDVRKDVRKDVRIRRQWILEQLAEGVELKTQMIAAQFDCSRKTAQRDLDLLRKKGQIERVGSRRGGHYRLVPPASG